MSNHGERRYNGKKAIQTGKRKAQGAPENPVDQTYV
jgi:hypothetical protein